MDLQNKFVFQFEKFELPLAKNPQALAVLADKINEAILASKLPKDKIAGVGIGMPGFIDAKKGINYSFMKTPGASISTYICEKIGLPVFIDNDSSLIALAEQRFGAARGKRTSLWSTSAGP